MSQIKNVYSKIAGLKIKIDDEIIIHAFNNLDSQFCLYFAIFNHKAQQKVQLLILFKLTKILKDEKKQLKKKNTASVNFVIKTKFNSTNHKKQSIVRKKSAREFNHKIEDCKISDRSYDDDCWHLKAECFYCHEIDYIS